MDLPTDANVLFNLLEGLVELDQEALVRAVLAMGYRLLPLFEQSWPNESGPRVSLEVTSRWCVNRHAVTRTELLEAGWAAGQASDQTVLEDPTAWNVAELAQRAAELAQCVCDEAREGLGHGASSAASMAIQAQGARGWDRLQTTIEDEVRPWVLGYRDPLSARLGP